MESKIDGVDNGTLNNMAFELDLIADHAYCTDREYAEEVRAVADYLKGKKTEGSHD